MHDREALLALASKVEAAVFDQIGREMLLEVFREAKPRTSFASGRDCDLARGQFIQLWEAGGPLDAAMTLVPEGWCIWQMGQVPDNGPLDKAFATLWQDGADNPAPHASAATMALALTAAALRAIANQEPSNG